MKCPLRTTARTVDAKYCISRAGREETILGCGIVGVICPAQQPKKGEKQDYYCYLFQINLWQPLKALIHQKQKHKVIR